MLLYAHFMGHHTNRLIVCMLVHNRYFKIFSLWRRFSCEPIFFTTTSGLKHAIQRNQEHYF